MTGLRTFFDKLRLGTPFAPVPDPIYGISRNKIATRLTADNWQKKAIWRQSVNGPVYIYLLHWYDESLEDKPRIYNVAVCLLNAEGNIAESFGETFTDLDSALACANGEGKSPVGVLTRPIRDEEIPPDFGPQMFISTRSRGGE